MSVIIAFMMYAVIIAIVAAVAYLVIKKQSRMPCVSMTGRSTIETRIPLGLAIQAGCTRADSESKDEKRLIPRNNL